MGRVAPLAVGEALWLPADNAAQAQTMQRTMSTKSRYPRELTGRAHSTARYTAVAMVTGDIAYLVRIERTA